MSAWGRDDLMVTSAFRYCLGRRTYIVSDCADWLVWQWPKINERAKSIIPPAGIAAGMGSEQAPTDCSDAG